MVRKSKIKTANKGYTIVELLVVIILIGLLTALVVVIYNGIQTRANEATAMHDLTTLGKTFQMMNTTDGSYPSNVVNSGASVATALQRAGLYDITRTQADGSLKKRFAICTPDGDVTKFAIIVVEPLLAGTASDFGKYTYTINQTGRVKKVQFNNTVSGYGSNLCVTAADDGRTTWTSTWGIQSHQVSL